MVIAHHLIWTAYGWWLPNDPRGSSSHEIRVEPIAELGELHHGRKAIQTATARASGILRASRSALKHQLLTFDDEDVQIIANGFRQAIQENGYACFACAIMPDHVHLLVRRHRDKAEVMIRRFQQATRELLVAEERRAGHHPTWGGPGWKVFLNTPTMEQCGKEYIRNNPLKAGLPEQVWDFVQPFMRAGCLVTGGDGAGPHRTGSLRARNVEASLPYKFLHDPRTGPSRNAPAPAAPSSLHSNESEPAPRIRFSSSTRH